MIHKAIISSKGQITIPARIRRELGVQEGDRIVLKKRGGDVVIAADTYEVELAALRARVSKHLDKHGLKGLSIEEMKIRADTAKIAAMKEKYGK